MARDKEVAKSLEKQLRFVKALYDNLHENAWLFLKNGATSDYYSANYRDKDHGKCALKRKIKMLRQELLNLERVLDDV